MAAPKRQHHRSLLITCISCTLAVILAHAALPQFKRLELKVRDQLVVHGRRANLHPDIVFLAIDNASVKLDLLMEDELAQSPTLQRMKETGFPYERDVYGIILERLVSAGAKVVAFDIMFPAEKPADPPFAAALEKFREQVVVGANLEARDQGAIAGTERFRHTLVRPANTLIPPPPPGQRLDPRVGFINFWPDEEDGIVRHTIYRTTSEKLDGLPPSDGGDPELTSFAARLLEKAGLAERIPPGQEPVLMRFIDTDKLRPTSLYEIFVPAIWDLPPRHGDQFLRGKIVVIGPDGNWVKDELVTPLGNTNGPRIHLSALNAALTGDFLRQAPPWANLLLIFGGGVVAWLLGRFVKRPLLRLLMLIAAVGGGYALAQTAFNAFGAFPLVFGPLLALASSGVTFSIVEQILERLEKAKLRKTFERYVSRDVVRELLDNPESYLNSLVGVRKRVTVLFSDVRGFTTITESGDAQALVVQLNEYFNEMVGIVFEQKGTLDKFIGDAVMAQWGGIVTGGEKTDAIRAVRTAVQMRKALARLNPGWKARGMIELKFGIGVNNGEAIVGNLGCEAKMEVSVIGDAVNTASRLEGMTKEFHNDLLVGETVVPHVREEFWVRTVALSLPKGKTVPLEIFTVLDERQPGIAAPDWLESHEEGVRLYRARRFDAAAEQFTAVLSRLPEDWLCQEYLGWCREYAAEPPPPEWNGVYVMTGK